MAKPDISPANSTMIQRLFSEMPYHVSQDSHSVPIISLVLVNPLVSDDVASITIIDGKMIINSSSSYIDNEILELTEHTIITLCAHFNNKYSLQGIQAALLPYSTAVHQSGLASTLLEGIYTISTTPVEIDRFTSTNFGVLQALAISLREQNTLKNLALSEMDLRTADNTWLDYWGKFFGYPRTSLEIGNDFLYRSRLQQEVTGFKSNNIALELLISASTGRDVSVRDGGQPFTFSGSTYTGTSVATTNYLTSLFTGSITITTFTGSILDNTLSVPSGVTLKIGNVISVSGVTTETNSYTIVGYGTNNTTYFVDKSSTLSLTTLQSIELISKFSPNTSTHRGHLQVVNNTSARQIVSSNGNSYKIIQCLESFVNSTTLVKQSTWAVLLNTGSATAVTDQSFVGSVITDPNAWTSYTNAYTMGPNSGTGSFLVLFPLVANETSLPYSLTSSLAPLLNRWKPAGIPYTIVAS